MPDGHYGPADPLHWPQCLQNSTKFPWLAALRKRPAEDLSKLESGCLWRVLTPDDFSPTTTSPATGSGAILGTVKEGLIQPLTKLVQAMILDVAQFQAECGVNRDLLWLSSKMRHALERLDFPATYRDLVRQHAAVQRYYLYTFAWLDFHVGLFKLYPGFGWHEPPDTNAMIGCMSTSGHVVQSLLEAGVPVWFIRDVEHFSNEDIIEQRCSFTAPVKHLPIDNLETLARHELELTGRITFTTLVGDRHIEWINCEAFHYADMESLPMPRSVVPTPPSISTRSPSAPSGVVRSNTSQKDVRFEPCMCTVFSGFNALTIYYLLDLSATKSKLTPSERAKFHPFRHTYLPPVIPVWETALSEIIATSTSRIGIDSWKYCVPEARLVVCSNAPDRQKRYVLNWLRVRDAWYYLLTHCAMHDEAVGPLKAPQWREYLNTSDITAIEIASSKTTKQAESKRQIATIFQKIFGRDILESKIPSCWFERSLEGIDETNWTRICQEIAWELGEVGFRYELTDIDRHLVPPVLENGAIDEEHRLGLIARVFPADCDLLYSRLPRQVEGMACEKICDRAAYFEALRQVVRRWPSVPLDIKDSTPLTLIKSHTLYLTMEKALARFYCQTFFELSGRAPVLPRRFPVVST